MGMLTDYFAAPDDEAAKGVLERGPKAAGLPTIEAKLLDPVVTMATLEQILLGTDAMTIIDDSRDSVIAGLEKEGPLIASLRPSLVEGLGTPDAARLLATARQWALTEELSDADPKDLYEFLWNLAHLAQWAVANRQQVYCWILP
ncbi:MAG TPA: hypothetical protein VJQ08_11775 [Candidatus Dormibacteraeota bacterium]|nr:hypothetical protein [Candidatus Dormibacteraeota bacterium]